MFGVNKKKKKSNGFGGLVNQNKSFKGTFNSTIQLSETEKAEMKRIVEEEQRLGIRHGFDLVKTKEEEIASLYIHFNKKVPKKIEMCLLKEKELRELERSGQIELNVTDEEVRECLNDFNDITKGEVGPEN